VSCVGSEEVGQIADKCCVVFGGVDWCIAGVCDLSIGFGSVEED
jgi:hypothetical protein